MRSLSTHVLDAVSGNPAADVRVTLARRSDVAGWSELASATTDSDGRVRELAPGGLDTGTYRLVFDTAAWFTATSQSGFYPEVAITFTVDEDRHYHVPLLLSPFAFSTYRGG
jgi:5-hydroxyisourate hydrolase